MDEIKKVALLSLAALAMTSIAGCSTTAPEDITTEPDTSDMTAQAPAQGDETAGGESDGSLVLTIGDDTWEFDYLMCVTGLEANESDVYSFVAYATNNADDAPRLDFFAELRDDSGQGRLDGEGVEAYIELIVYEGGEIAGGHTAQTDVGWDGNTASVSVGQGSIQGTGDFFVSDEFIFGAASTPGTFSGSCGADSLG